MDNYYEEYMFVGEPDPVDQVADFEAPSESLTSDFGEEA